MQRLVYKEKYEDKYRGIIVKDGVELCGCGNAESEEEANELLDKVLARIEGPPETTSLPTLAESIEKFEEDRDKEEVGSEDEDNDTEL